MRELKKKEKVIFVKVLETKIVVTFGEGIGPGHSWTSHSPLLKYN